MYLYSATFKLKYNHYYLKLILLDYVPTSFAHFKPEILAYREKPKLGQTELMPYMNLQIFNCIKCLDFDWALLRHENLNHLVVALRVCL